MNSEFSEVFVIADLYLSFFCTFVKATKHGVQPSMKSYENAELLLINLFDLTAGYTHTKNKFDNSAH